MRQGQCELCGSTAWINNCIGRAGIPKVRAAIPPGEYCGECFEKFDLGEVKLQPKTGRASTKEDDGSPGQQSAARILEDMTGYDP